MTCPLERTKKALDYGLKITISDLRHPRVDEIIGEKLQRQLALKQQQETSAQKAIRLQLNKDKKQLGEIMKKVHAMAKERIARARDEHFRDELTLRQNLAHRAICQRLEQAKAVLSDLSAAKLPDSSTHLEALRNLATQPTPLRQVRSGNGGSDFFGPGSFGSGSAAAFQPVSSLLSLSESGTSNLGRQFALKVTLSKNVIHVFVIGRYDACLRFCSQLCPRLSYCYCHRYRNRHYLLHRRPCRPCRPCRCHYLISSFLIIRGIHSKKHSQCGITRVRNGDGFYDRYRAIRAASRVFANLANGIFLHSIRG